MSGWILAGLAALALVIAAVIVLAFESDLGGSTGDKIAEHIEQDCGDSTREKVDPEDLDVPAFSNQAMEVIRITCPSGYVNPFAELTRFTSADALRGAFQTSGPKIQRDWFCVAGREAISGDFRGFAGLCNELGGSFRCPPACQDRVRAHRIPPVPGQVRS